jgi:phosphoribosyl-dephospho-CoA transferase
VRLLAWQAMFLPLDGEIVFPDGAAVSWKEWRQVAVLGAGRRARCWSSGPPRGAEVGSLLAALPQEQPCAA